MKKALSIRFLIVIISLLATIQGHACWYLNGPQDYRFWLLNPVVVNSKELSPFYFSSYYLFNGSQTIFEAESTHYDLNVTEWCQYLQKAARLEDIYDAQYKIGTDSFFLNEDDLSTSNSFIKLLHKKKYRNELQYFKLAKRLEDASYFDLGRNTLDPPISRDTSLFTRMIVEANSLYARVDNRFIKSRIAYQLIRLHLFDGSFKEGKKVYENMFLPNVDKQSWLYGAGMYFQAMLTDTMRAYDYYQMSLAFDISPNKRAAVARKIPVDSIGAILKFATTNHDRAVIHTIRAIQYPGRSLDEIKLIYQLDPWNKDITFLLMREVSKLEDWLKTPVYTNHSFDGPSFAFGDFKYQFDEGNYRKDSLYGIAVHAFIDSISDKVKGKAVAHICAAQLSLLMNNPMDAAMHLDEAEKRKLTEGQAYYIKVARLLCDVLREPILSNHTETELLRIFRKGENNPYVVEPNLFTEQLKLFVANTLITKGDTAVGIYLMSKSSRCIGGLPISNAADSYTRLAEIGTPAVYDRMLQLFSKLGKSPFEKYITRPFILNVPWMGTEYEISANELKEMRQWNIGMFINLKATWYINHDMLEHALAVYDGIPDSVWNRKEDLAYMTGRPYLPKILPYSADRIIGADTSIHAITRPAYLRGVIDLKHKVIVQRGDDRARTCLKIAGAYYQMSYYGEYWIMNRILWSYNDQPKVLNEFNDIFFGCSRAKFWYAEAERYANSEQVASLSAIMVRYCDKLYSRYVSTVKQGGYWTDLAYSSSTRNKALERRFRKHPTYDDMIDECH